MKIFSLIGEIKVAVAYQRQETTESFQPHQYKELRNFLKRCFVVTNSAQVDFLIGCAGIAGDTLSTFELTVNRLTKQGIEVFAIQDFDTRKNGDVLLRKPLRAEDAMTLEISF